MKKLFLFGVILSLALGSCKKCFECSNLNASFIFSKNGDTMRTAVFYLKAVEDTIGYYSNSGYKCDTVYMFWYKDINSRPICGHEDIYDKTVALGGRCEYQ